MSDRYAGLVNAPLIGPLAGRAGLPRPVPLRRQRPGEAVYDGPVLVAGGPQADLAEWVVKALDDIGVDHGDASFASGPVHGLIFDAGGIADCEQLVALRDFFQPLLPRLGECGRIVVLGRPPELCPRPRLASAQRALEGIVRSLAKEVGRGVTAQLLCVAPGGASQLSSTLRFLLSARSAYVSGQVIRIGVGPPVPDFDAQRPLAGRRALVTGAARGIGLAIAQVLARDGAHVVGLDVPETSGKLMAAMEELGGASMRLDITSAEAPPALTERFADGLDILVHNAGITRDRTLAKMPADRWQAVIDLNICAQERVNEALLEHDVIGEGGRIVCVSSLSGIAGNAGQTNYAASKAAVIGMVAALAPELERRDATISAVAPGFIETDMTARMPLAVREAGRRLNSMRQGGLPVDVAEVVAWLAAPDSGGLNGNVVRVCGQSLLGA